MLTSFHKFILLQQIWCKTRQLLCSFCLLSVLDIVGPMLMTIISLLNFIFFILYHFRFFFTGTNNNLVVASHITYIFRGSRQNGYRLSFVAVNNFERSSVCLELIFFLHFFPFIYYKTTFWKCWCCDVVIGIQSNSSTHKIIPIYAKALRTEKDTKGRVRAPMCVGGIE